MTDSEKNRHELGKTQFWTGVGLVAFGGITLLTGGGAAALLPLLAGTYDIDRGKHLRDNPSDSSWDDQDNPFDGL